MVESFAGTLTEREKKAWRERWQGSGVSVMHPPAAREEPGKGYRTETST